MPHSAFESGTLAEPTAPLDLLLTREVSFMLRFSSPDATIAFLREHGCQPVSRGRAFLWRRADILALLNQQQAPGAPSP